MAATDGGDAPPAHVDPMAAEPMGEAEFMEWYDAHAEELTARGITLDVLEFIPPEQLVALWERGGLEALDAVVAGLQGDDDDDDDDGDADDASQDDEDDSTDDVPPARNHAPAPAADGADDDVSHQLDALAADRLESLVINKKRGWTNDIVTRHVAPALGKAQNIHEIVLVDLINDNVIIAICEAVRQNPVLRSFGMVITEHGRPGFFTLVGVEHISVMVATTPLQNLFLNNCLHALLPQCTELLAQSLYVSELSRLDLSRNSIYDDAFLPLARALAAQPTHPLIADLNLTNNDLSYDGFEMMWEVMAYNRALTTVGLDGNCVRIPTDTWEGFNIQEQCRVNREMLRLGLYTTASHHKWPRLFRRKMNRLWYVWKNFKFHSDINIELWESVLQYVNGRGYVNQKVRLWMKQHR